jgi:lipoate-protein ligase B
MSNKRRNPIFGVMRGVNTSRITPKIVDAIIMEPICEVELLGLVPYEEAWRLQEKLAAEIAAGKRPPTLLLLEHPHTYTFGRRGKLENLLWDEAERQRRGIAVHWVDRGGDVTYHGPGQLVGYPLLPLAPGDIIAGGPSSSPRLPQADYVGYVRRLEQALIIALAQLGLASGQIQGLTGVWVQPEAVSHCQACPPELRHKPAKVAAIGVKVDVHGVSLHGFALNVDPVMDFWQGIVGCGLKDYAVSSLAQLLDPPPDMEKVMQAVIAAFGKVFGYKVVLKQ